MRNHIKSASQTLQQQWVALIDLAEHQHQQEGAVSACLTAQFGAMAGYLFDTHHAYRLDKIYDQLRNIFEADLREWARRRGTPVKIDLAGYCPWDLPHLNRSDTADVVAYARSLSFEDMGERVAADYNEDSLLDHALREAATTINEYLKPHAWTRGSHIKERGSKRIIERPITPDPYTNQWQLTWSNKQRLVEVLGTLLTFADDVVPGLCTGEIRAAQAQIDEGSYHSRMRVALGPQVELVFFKDKVEWVFDAEALQDLMIQLRTHAVPSEA